ncbi:MAG: PH domain-containing protein [bacterium]|nr:PH domain-containing protein [bacterium]
MTSAVATPTERLAPRVIVYWLLADGISATFLTGLAWFIGRPIAAEWDKWTPTYEWLLLAACIAFLAVAVLSPPLAFVRWRFGFLDDLLLMRYGILFVEERAVPVRRMQHVDMTRGPIERLFGLATLVVFTAGNEGSAFRVPGLRLARAQELRDRIVEARGDGRL